MNAVSRFVPLLGRVVDWLQKQVTNGDHCGANQVILVEQTAKVPPGAKHDISKFCFGTSYTALYNQSTSALFPCLATGLHALKRVMTSKGFPGESSALGILRQEDPFGNNPRLELLRHSTRYSSLKQDPPVLLIGLTGLG